MSPASFRLEETRCSSANTGVAEGCQSPLDRVLPVVSGVFGLASTDAVDVPKRKDRRTGSSRKEAQLSTRVPSVRFASSIRAQ